MHQCRQQHAFSLRLSEHRSHGRKLKQLLGGRTHHNRIWFSDGLETSRNIDRLAQGKALRTISHSNIINDHWSGVNADANMERNRIMPGETEF